MAQIADAIMAPAGRNGAYDAVLRWVLLMALIAVAAIAVYQLFGQVVRSQTAAMAKELAGEDGSSQSKAASTAAKTAAEQTKSRSLQSFTGNAKAAK